MYRFIVFVRRVVDGVESAIGDTLTAAGPDWAYDTTEARCGGGGALIAGSSRSSTFADSQRLAHAYPLDECGG